MNLNDHHNSLAVSLIFCLLVKFCCCICESLSTAQLFSYCLDKIWMSWEKLTNFKPEEIYLFSRRNLFLLNSVRSSSTLLLEKDSDERLSS